MRARIVPIKDVPGCSEVLLAMFEDKEGTPFLELSAWHTAVDGYKEFQSEAMYMETEMMMEAFIESIRPDQLAAWANKFYQESMVSLNEKLK